MQKRRNNPIAIRELESDSDFAAACGIIGRLNPHLALGVIKSRMKDMRKNGYRCVGAFEDVALVGLSGFWIGCRIWCGPYIDFDNVIVLESRRGQGIGERIIKWLEAQARKEGCTVAVLDTYATSTRAHKFYFREGYHIEGYHMVKELGEVPVSRTKR